MIEEALSSQKTFLTYFFIKNIARSHPAFLNCLNDCLESLTDQRRSFEYEKFKGSKPLQSLVLTYVILYASSLGIQGAIFKMFGPGPGFAYGGVHQIIRFGYPVLASQKDPSFTTQVKTTFTSAKEIYQQSLDHKAWKVVLPVILSLLSVNFIEPRVTVTPPPVQPLQVHESEDHLD